MKRENLNVKDDIVNVPVNLWSYQEYASKLWNAVSCKAYLERESIDEVISKINGMICAVTEKIRTGNGSWTLQLTREQLIQNPESLYIFLSGLNPVS